jgi:UDP-3-O-[3-hydroxymyristoyl] glucosamine N-acyltransferase
MTFTVEQVAALINGKVEGDAKATISNIAKIEEAQKGDICFLANSKYEQYLYSTKASAVIISDNYELKSAIESALIRVNDPYASFSTLLEEYKKIIVSTKSGIEQHSFQSKTANIGSNCYLGAFSYIGENTKIGNNVKIYPNSFIGDNAIIGDNTIIYAGVKIYSNCKVGNNCILHAGCVIGSDGFGYAPLENGTYKSVPQLGNVVLEDNVDIGANTTIDCATMGSTLIKKGVKIDNLVQIAHNVEIGENTAIAAQTGISGSTKIGKNCIIAGQVGIVGHLKIADKTTIGAQSGVSKSVEESGTIIQGSPAFDYKQNLRSMVIFKNLPNLQRKIEQLEEKILNLLTVK